MKKLMLTVISITIISLSGCIISDNFDTYHKLAQNALSLGSKKSTKEYSNLLQDLATTNEQKAIANMISGYAHYLSEEYNQALSYFFLSLDYQSIDATNAGIILAYFMLNQTDMVDYHINKLYGLADKWTIRINHNEITKSKICEICTLSSAINLNSSLFNILKEQISNEQAQKMEGFFFE